MHTLSIRFRHIDLITTRACMTSMRINGVDHCVEGLYLSLGPLIIALKVYIYLLIKLDRARLIQSLSRSIFLIVGYSRTMYTYPDIIEYCILYVINMLKCLHGKRIFKITNDMKIGEIIKSHSKFPSIWTAQNCES